MAAKEGYCVKCKAKKEIKDAQEITMKNGRPATQGTVPGLRHQDLQDRQVAEPAFSIVRTPSACEPAASAFPVGHRRIAPEWPECSARGISPMRLLTLR